jgi:hydrogenase-4 component F
MEFIILLTIPILAALFSGLVRNKRALIEAITVGAVCIEAVSVASLAFRVAREGTVGYSAYLSLNALGALFALAVALVGCVVAFYSVGYIREEMKRGMIGMHRVRQFYALFHMFLFSMFVAVSITNPVLMWIAVEATTLSTVFLISFYGKPNTIEAAWKFLIINSVALLLGFFGTVLFISMPTIFGATWSFARDASLDPAFVKLAFIFVLIGYGTKTGFVPLHTWLPDAHGMAPVPISSLLSGALLNVSFFAILRFKLLTDSMVGTAFSQNLFLAFGILSVVTASLLIFTQYNYKRLLAYSSIEHMGVMALGFGAGGIGVFAALLHMLYHAITKSLLFLSSGNIILKYGTSKISGVRGLGRALPLTASIFIIGTLSITGVPPFGIFITEVSILSSLMAEHMVLALITIAALALVCVGFFKCLSSMMAGQPPHDKTHGEETAWTLAPLIVLVVILGGVSVTVPSALNVLLEGASTFFN